MPASIMPAFIRWPKEAEVISHLLAGYGELEFELCLLLAEVLGDDKDSAVRITYRNRGEEARINVTDAFLRPSFAKLGGSMEAYYCEIIAAMRQCRVIRNQYAHCHWTDDHGGLRFVVLEAEAKKSTQIKLTLNRVDIGLLVEQEDYFKFTQRGFLYLKHEYALVVRGGAIHPFPRTPVVPKPRLHNGS